MHTTSHNCPISTLYIHLNFHLDKTNSEKKKVFSVLWYVFVLSPAKILAKEFSLLHFGPNEWMGSAKSRIGAAYRST